MIALHFCVSFDDAWKSAADLADGQQARGTWGERAGARVNLLLERPQPGFYSLHERNRDRDAACFEAPFHSGARILEARSRPEV